jgi:F420-dependent oxidoreductase-like protein
VPFVAPLARTREYVDIVRMALARQTVSYAGTHFTLPLPDGPGKALKLTIHPPRTDIPIYLAAVGPRNLELAGEIADGWHAIFFSPEHSGDLVASVERGRHRAGKGTPDSPLDGFDIAPAVPVVIADDVEAAAEAIRPYAALYVGGMGSREQNFYNQLVQRYGFEDAAREVQDLYLEGKREEAMAALPDELIDLVSLCGPPDRVRERLAVYRDAGVGTLGVTPLAWDKAGRLEQLRLVAELAG